MARAHQQQREWQRQVDALIDHMSEEPPCSHKGRHPWVHWPTVRNGATRDMMVKQCKKCGALKHPDKGNWMSEEDFAKEFPRPVVNGCANGKCKCANGGHKNGHYAHYPRH